MAIESRVLLPRSAPPLGALRAAFHAPRADLSLTFQNGRSATTRGQIGVRFTGVPPSPSGRYATHTALIGALGPLSVRVTPPSYDGSRLGGCDQSKVVFWSSVLKKRRDTRYRPRYSALHVLGDLRLMGVTERQAWPATARRGIPLSETVPSDSRRSAGGGDDSAPAQYRPPVDAVERSVNTSCLNGLAGPGRPVIPSQTGDACEGAQVPDCDLPVAVTGLE